ncbi:exopolysaccharide biosynthesis protein [Rhizobium laguerreae]|uniref:Exopolysaccharide biosynthesis protein n=2 Tax=Rhizobium TaxID=379 RepID=A0A7K3VI86_RHILE|nr:exopolysaccharide biosynthesis protein [Rhizobium laguerreae]MBY5331899.1 exopolysaccharide biosynthesis protein [Rhizobium leguminosarum]MBY3093978.1 exopolysaccharide biosynthesis protein [Rhizobium laguerreae]MBY3098987.1 exopolysaccharide biosynthesis protein [Rhizobium laguerreae]MBY3108988.1 exopolysaccharide biosynthesis protein [Rhizobium laguerreae]
MDTRENSTIRRARPKGRRLSSILRQMAADQSRERISIGDIFDTMGDRAISALMLIFALPNAFPTPPGTSAVLGAPLVFLAAQLTFGLKPWLPKVIANRSMRREDFETIVGRIHRWLAWAERMLKPRLAIFAEPPAEYLAGAACLLLSIVLLLPVPLGNILPAVTISVFAFGILGRDGLFALIGFVMTAVSLVVAGGVIYGLVKAGIYLVVQWFA